MFLNLFNADLIILISVSTICLDMMFWLKYMKKN